jgi:hypothetical protein
MAATGLPLTTISQGSFDPSASLPSDQSSSLTGSFTPNPETVNAAGYCAASLSTQTLQTAADAKVSSSPQSLLFWNSKEVVAYARKASTLPNLFPNGRGDYEEIRNLSPEDNDSAVWIDASIAGPYMALLKSSQSPVRVGACSSIL